MRSGSRFHLNSAFLLAVIFGLAFLILGTPAQAGCFGKLFGRHRAAACGSGGYSSYQSYQYQNAAPCGQSYNYAAAPCAPCGQTTNYAPAPVYYPTQAPPVYSAPPPAPQTGLRWNCNGTSCTLVR